MDTSYAVVVCGGDAPPIEVCRSIIENASLLVAADSGFNHLERWAIPPHCIVGDFDSIKGSSNTDRYQQIRYPRDKDETDTELAIDWTKDQGFDSVVLLGGGGGRPDHFLALTQLFVGNRAPIMWMSDAAEFILVKGLANFSFDPGESISLFPLGREVIDVISSGLHWPLEGHSWAQGFYSLSNRVSAGPVSLNAQQGRLLLVRNFNWDHPITDPLSLIDRKHNG